MEAMWSFKPSLRTKAFNYLLGNSVVVWRLSSMPNSKVCRSKFSSRGSSNNHKGPDKAWREASISDSSKDNLKQIQLTAKVASSVLPTCTGHKESPPHPWGQSLNLHSDLRPSCPPWTGTKRTPPWPTRQGPRPTCTHHMGMLSRVPNLLQGMSCLMSCKVITCYTQHGCTFRAGHLCISHKSWPLSQSCPVRMRAHSPTML